MILSDRQKLAAALNQHCGGEERRKRFMRWKWGVDSFSAMGDAVIVSLVERYSPAYVERAWAVTDKLREDVYEFSLLSVIPIDNAIVLL